jgi:ferredoxin
LKLAAGGNLLEGLLGAGIAVGNDCGGNAQCATCRVVVKSGAESLADMSDLETYALSRVRKQGVVRLACQVWVAGDLEVEVLDVGEG